MVVQLIEIACAVTIISAFLLTFVGGILIDHGYPQTNLLSLE